MFALEVTLLVTGLIALVIGYSRNSRNTLLCAALILLAAGALSQFVSGFNASREGHRASPSTAPAAI